MSRPSKVVTYTERSRHLAKLWSRSVTQINKRYEDPAVVSCFKNLKTSVKKARGISQWIMYDPFFGYQWKVATLFSLG